jgi:hypothetical protein
LNRLARKEISDKFQVPAALILLRPMHEYDVALKRILTRPGSSLLFALTGCAELLWLNVELPKVNNLCVDLLGAAPSGESIHFEFQTRNRRDLPVRMGEYAFSIRRRYGKYPRRSCCMWAKRRYG